jgi:hypothetical protein
MDFGESPLDRYELAVWAGGHVAEGQRAAKGIRRGLELAAQGAAESAFFGFDESAGVVGDQTAQQGAGVLGVAQVPGAVKRVEARRGKAGGVADVVQPRRGFDQVGVHAEDTCQAACPGGDALDVRPAAG